MNDDVRTAHIAVVNERPNLEDVEAYPRQVGGDECQWDVIAYEEIVGGALDGAGGLPPGL